MAELDAGGPSYDRLQFMSRHDALQLDELRRCLVRGLSGLVLKKKRLRTLISFLEVLSRPEDWFLGGECFVQGCQAWRAPAAEGTG